MIYDLTYNDKAVNEAIKEVVGVPIPLFRRFKYGGVGSQRFLLEKGIDISEDGQKSGNSLKFCNIEIRSNGILIWFHSNAQVLAYTIPFDAMTIQYTDDKIILGNLGQTIVLAPAHNAKLDQRFVKKLISLKSQNNDLLTTNFN